MTKATFSYLYGKLRVMIHEDNAKLVASDWKQAVEIDPNSLDQQDQDNYELYKEAYAEMKAAKTAFETGLRAKLGVVETPKAEAKAKGAVSLGDFLKARMASGLSS